MNYWTLFSWSFVVCLAATDWAFAQPNVKEMMRLNPQMGRPLDIDDSRAEALGLRKISGTYLTMYTDIPSREDIDELVAVFDAAVPQWCRLFGITSGKARHWSLVAFLMRDREKFRKAGMLPDELPKFPTGYNRGYHFWVVEQPGNYYTRHLVLHEGTHAFMQWFLGGSGPAWYSEGMAEKLALHRWENGRLELNARLTHADQCEFWGRPKVIRDAVARKQTMRLDQVFDLSAISFYDAESYAWAWAACEFLSGHPFTTEEYRKLPKHADVTTADFSAKFKSWFEKEWWVQIERDWQTFLSELTYGTTADRTTILPAVCESRDGYEVATILADRNWQISTKLVQKGDEVRVSASGQFIVMQVDPRRPLGRQDFRGDRGARASPIVGDEAADAPPAEESEDIARIPIPCEANGVSLRYHQGQRVGMLMAAILNEDYQLSPPIPIGTEATFIANADGAVVFRINESPAELHDNSGKLEVKFGK